MAETSDTIELYKKLTEPPAALVAQAATPSVILPKALVIKSDSLSIEQRIRKISEIPPTEKSSSEEKELVVGNLIQASRTDPNFEKKLAALEKYNFSIIASDRVAPGKPGLGNTLGFWSGLENPNRYTLHVNAKDFGANTPILEAGLKQMKSVEAKDMSRLFDEVLNPPDDGATSKQRYGFYLASRERLDAFNSALGEPPSKPYPQENALREKIGLPPIIIKPEPQAGSLSMTVPQANGPSKDLEKLAKTLYALPVDQLYTALHNPNITPLDLKAVELKQVTELYRGMALTQGDKEKRDGSKGPFRAFLIEKRESDREQYVQPQAPASAPVQAPAPAPSGP